MKRRLFLGIAIGRDISKRIDRKIESLTNLPVIWTPAENRHMTLLFLGWVDDEQLGDIAARIGEACERVRACDATLDRIVVAPESNPDRIEMTGEKNDDLRDLANALSSAFDTFSPDRKSFHPHVTLGRIRRSAWKKITPAPHVDIPIRFSVPVTEVSLFESVVMDGKRRYVSVETISLA